MPSTMDANGTSHDVSQGGNLGNGVVGKMENSTIVSKLNDKITDTTSEDALTTTNMEVAPPLPHITQGFVPLSTLLGRLVQDSYGKLIELVDTLNDGNDAARKKRMMKYLNDTRQQFIKALVLTQWARNSEDVSRVIDLKIWTDSQIMQYHRVVYDLLEVRKGLINAKVPNPDISTAVQILGSGQPTFSAAHKRYVPPEILTSKEILGYLQNINTLLCLRFALHDVPPTYFNTYTIRSGRATFTVPEEFEVDMSIADENPLSQLYLIDFRLVFTPTLDTKSMERLQNEVEARGNELLRTEGLTGIYNFLHDFVLTHKIAILRRQATAMMQGKWADVMLVTMMKRTLVLQYWVGRPGPKSWLEVGISRGNKGSNRPSTLALRWMKDAKEVKNVEIPFNQGDLSAEILLKTVITIHTGYLLTSIRDNLQSYPIFPEKVLELQTQTNPNLMSYLNVQLTVSRVLMVMVEPITGRFALKKPSAMVMRGERMLNDLPDPAAKAHETIMRIRFMSMQEEIETRAKSMGWDILKMLSPRLQDLKKWFGALTSYLMYLRKQSWTENWIIVVSLGTTGDFWWIAEIKEAARGWSIPDAQQIPITGPQNVTYQFLENLEKMVASFITLYSNTRKLSATGVPYKFLPTNNPNAPVIVPTLNINFSALTKSDWAVNVLRLSLHDLDQMGNITILVEGRMKNPMSKMKSTELSGTNGDVAFHPRSGTFILRFIVPVGAVITSAIVERLRRIERLITFITMVQKYRLPALHVTLDKMSFNYCLKPTLAAEVTFSTENEMKLSFDSDTPNPHRRINSFLDMLLNDQGLEAVVWTLRITLPLLSALDEIEENTPETALTVIARSTEWYRLQYPEKGVLIDIKLRTRRSSIWWFIKDVTLAHATHEGALGTANGNEHVVASQLRKLWLSSDSNIEGLKTGSAATVDQVSKVVKAIHRLIMEGQDMDVSQQGASQQQQQPIAV